MKRKVKFQEGGPVYGPSRPTSAITNEPVGARLRRFLSSNSPREPAQAPPFNGEDILENRRRLAEAARRAAEARGEASRRAIAERTEGELREPGLRENLRRGRWSDRPAPRGGAAVGENIGPAVMPASPLMEADLPLPPPPPPPVEAAPARRRMPPRRAEAPSRGREMTADQLNEMVLRQLGREPFETVPEMPSATGPDAAVARERIAARMAQPYKKGGMVKPKAPIKKAAGGMLAPKRAKGPAAVKPYGTKGMAKAVAGKKPVPMPAFKKGGPVKKAKGGMIGRGCK